MITLLALAAIAAQSLWPVVAHAKARPRLPAAELCSSEGARPGVAIPPDGGTIAAGHVLCSLCLTGCERGFAVPCAASGAAPAPLATAQAPAADVADFASRRSPPARSRAPPRIL